MALLYFLLIAWVLTAAGRVIAKALRIPDSASILEKNLIGYAIGLVLFAYGMLAIGLAGALYSGVALGWVAVLGLIGLVQYPSMARESVSILTTCFHPQRAVWLMMAVLAFFSGVSLIGCFAPPVVGVPVLQSILTEYDSIAYHLADPKLYIDAHRIYPIYWEHHSNFAFTGEMWYTFGLLFHSVPLAKLFHWSCGLGCALAIYRLGLRFLGQRAGVIAVIIFASTPLVFWEAGTAYVDLVATFFTTLTLLTVSIGIAEDDDKWLCLSAVMMGLTLSSKATAVISLGLFAVGLLYWRLRVKRQPIGPVVRQVALWCVIALVVGCPWYVKSIAYTGNPIYPFYFKLFGGKYWSLQNGAAYDAANTYFGVGHQPVNLLMAPWNLVMYLMPGHPASMYPNLGHGNAGNKPFNDFPTEFGTLSPVLLAALFVPAFLRLRNGVGDAFVKSIAAFAGASMLVWLVTTQYGRYMLPFYPALCIIAAWAVDRALALRTITGWTLGALTGASVIFSGYLAVSLAEVQLPVATGRQTVDDYVGHGYGGYEAMQYINQQLPSGSKIAFYGNPLGFYCNKPYLWAEAGHSTFIPYDKMKSSDDLLAYFRSTHVTHVLVNRQYFNWPPAGDAVPWVNWLYQLTAGQSSPIFDHHGYTIYELPGAHS